MTLRLLTAFLLVAATSSARTEANVVYAMRGGLAMLMDVHYPSQSNGYGIVFISGSGWHAALSYDATPLKDSGFARRYVPPLTAGGFTVFVINHRAAPRYRYPMPLEDAQRAVRFVRRNAATFGIDAERIGGVGGSSGGHLISMLGVLDGHGDLGSQDPIERESAKLQAVFARAAPTDLTKVRRRFSSASVSSLMGLRLGRNDPPNTVEHRTFWEASPAAHVSPDDPPFLLVHGTADDRVPYERSTEFAARLRADGIATEVVTVDGGGHGATFPGAPSPPDYLGAMVTFFETHLSRGATSSHSPPPERPRAERIERNVTFGMVSGGALLMDVYRPTRPNGFGVVHVTGSGWHSPLSASARQQKDSRQVEIFGLPLVKAGYTLFAVNHRTAPLNKYPSQLEDVQRSVRFIRHHASRWGISSETIGGIGGSSGGHLTLLLGLLPAPGRPSDADPVERESANLQAIVPWAPPTDLVRHNGTYGYGTLASLFGMRLMARDPETSAQHRAYSDASPIRHVSSDDPPTLLIHGDADAVVPLWHSEDLARKLRERAVEAEVLTVPGGGHGANFPNKAADAPDYVSAAVAWFDRHLKE